MKGVSFRQSKGLFATDIGVIFIRNQSTKSAMKNIAILVPETAVVEAVADPRYAFTAVNEFLKSAGDMPLFHVQLVGLSSAVRVTDGMFTIHTDATPATTRRPDLIIIPAISGDLDRALQLNKDFLPWIVQQYKQGTEVASLCIGAFLLAETGLLNGKRCSTHWLFANEFRKRYPEVELLDNKIVTDQTGLYTSGGANSYWNLLLYLIEKYTNREMAVLTAKFFVLDIDRNSQSPFHIFKGQKVHNDPDIVKVQEYIETNYQDKITVDELCRKFGIARRTFERRFKKATHNTVLEYWQRVKIEAAKRQLEMSRKTVGEVMYEVGYSDTKAFRDIFRKVTSMSPVDYRNKYNKEALN
jgi:transcriptional regulator GlxA family with amidase domain